jgi:hypothetical protein
VNSTVRFIPNTAQKMPTHQQLTYVRNRSRLSQDECREQFLRRWPGAQNDFDRCWAENAKDLQRDNSYLLARYTFGLKTLLAIFGLTISMVLYIELAYTNVRTRNLWTIEILIAIVTAYYFIQTMRHRT